MVKENVQFLKNNRAEWILIQNLNGLQLTWIRNKLQKIQNLKKIVRRLARSISGTWLEKYRLANYCERTKVKHFETVLNDIATKKKFGRDFGYFFWRHIFFSSTPVWRTSTCWGLRPACFTNFWYLRKSKFFRKF